MLRHRRPGRQRAGGALVESLCPLLIAVLVLDSLTRVAWAAYSGRDVQIYASVARLWSDGYLPYRDVYDFKPPLIFAVLRVAFDCWGYHPDSLRRVLMLLTGLGALSLYFGLRRGGHTVAAPVAAMSFMTLIVPDMWSLAFQNTEVLVAVFAACALGCAAAHERTPRGWWWAVGSGGCAALAALGKQPGVLFVVPLLVHLALWGSPDGWVGHLRHAAGRLVLFALGFAGIIGLVAGYFAWHGALSALVEAVVVDGQRYAAVDASTLLTPSGWSYLLQRPSSRLIAAWMVGAQNETQLGYIFTRWCFIGPLYFLVPATVLRPSRLTVIAWLWVLAGYGASIAGPANYDHYSIVAYPALALVAGVGAEALFGRWSNRPSAAKAPWVAVGIGVALLLFTHRWLVSYVPRRALDLSHDASEGGDLFGERIRAVAKPGDTLFLENEPFTIYLYAGVPPPTRFIYWNAPHPDADRERQEALRRFPSFIVFRMPTYELLRDESAIHDPRYGLTAEILRDYEELFAHPDVVIMRRRDSEENPLLLPSHSPAPSDPWGADG